MNRKAIEEVRQFYNNADQFEGGEWGRLEANPFEFELTTWMMDRYIQPGHSVLDIGGGPGRYSIYYAQKGCAVTLAELSEVNVEMARKQAALAGAAFEAYAVNCLELVRLGLGQFDHVLLMGPLYHLLDPADQVEAVNIALRHLKPGGKLYAVFIHAFGGIVFALQHPGVLSDCWNSPDDQRLMQCIQDGTDYCGPGFTSVYMSHPNNILPFMDQFPLKKLHLFSQEGFLAPNKFQLMERDPAEVRKWVELAKRYLELPELLSWAEHIMYIGEKEG